MPSKRAVVLVPGLFGFDRFTRADGTVALEYFVHVRAALEKTLGDVVVVTCRTPPTGSLQCRAFALLDALREVPRDAEIHVVGHSTGGLDAVLLMRNDWPWRTSPPDDLDALVRGIRSVVTLSAPLRGAPYAPHVRRLGIEDSAVWLLALAASTKVPRATSEPLWHLASMLLGRLSGDRGHALSRIVRAIGADETTQAQLARFLDDVVTDHELLVDLSPDVTAPLLPDRSVVRERVRLVNVVTVAPSPPLLPRPDLGKAYAVSYRLAAPWFELRRFERELPPGTQGIGAAPRALGPRDNDGVVPACSQWLDGVVPIVVRADHLDVVGHYNGGGDAHVSVFDSGARFRAPEFESLWTTIADTLRS